MTANGDRALEPDAPFLPSGAAVEPRTPVPLCADTPGTAQGNSAAHLGDVAAVIDQAVAAVCNSWRPSFAVRAAEAVERAGFVRVVEDDDTVTRVARSLLAIAQPNLTWESAGQFWRDVMAHEARAAVRAVLAGNCQSTPSPSQAGSSRRHDCCPHCTATTGSCVRCGVRDAADGEQLCVECDGALEAEFGSGGAAVRAIRKGDAQ